MAQPQQRTTFLSLPAELRIRLYTFDLRGRTTRHNEPDSTRLAEPALLRVSRQVRTEALMMYLAEVKVVVIGNIVADGYDSTVAAALVPLLEALELRGFNLRADGDHQQKADEVAAALGRAGMALCASELGVRRGEGAPATSAQHPTTLASLLPAANGWCPTGDMQRGFIASISCSAS